MYIYFVLSYGTKGYHFAVTLTQAIEYGKIGMIMSTTCVHYTQNTRANIKPECLNVY